MNKGQYIGLLAVIITCFGFIIYAGQGWYDALTVNQAGMTKVLNEINEREAKEAAWYRARIKKMAAETFEITVLDCENPLKGLKTKEKDKSLISKKAEG